nr:MAG TPA: hypothetical protein [Caudoviricetes sp.]
MLLFFYKNQKNFQIYIIYVSNKKVMSNELYIK